MFNHLFTIQTSCIEVFLELNLSLTKKVTAMKTKVSILFYAKRAKASVNGLAPIYTRITVNG